MYSNVIDNVGRYKEREEQETKEVEGIVKEKI